MENVTSWIVASRLDEKAVNPCPAATSEPFPGRPSGRSLSVIKSCRSMLSTAVAM